MRPVIEMGEVAAVAVIFPGVEVTVKPVIGKRLLEDGAVNLTVAAPLRAMAVTLVGALGTV